MSSDQVLTSCGMRLKMSFALHTKREAFNSVLLFNEFVFQPKDRTKIKKEASPGFERNNSVTSDASMEVYR